METDMEQTPKNIRPILLILVVIVVVILVPIILYRTRKPNSTSLISAKNGIPSAFFTPLAKTINPMIIRLLENPTIQSWNVIAGGTVTNKQNGDITISSNKGTLTFTSDKKTQFINLSTSTLNATISPTTLSNADIKTGDYIQVNLNIPKSSESILPYGSVITLFPKAILRTPTTQAPSSTITQHP